MQGKGSRSFVMAQSGLFGVAGVLLLILFAACGSEDASARPPGDAENRAAAVSSDTLRFLIAERVDTDRAPDPVEEHVWEHVRAIYTAREHAPVWIDGGRPNDRARALLSHLSSVHEDGLRVEDYQPDRMEQQLGSLSGSDPSAEATLEAELRLTSLFVQYGEDMLTGRIAPRSVEQSWHIDPSEPDIDSLLVRIVRAEDFERGLASLRPRDEAYAGLRRSLARYREIGERGGWPSVASGSVLTPGDSSERVPAVRARLAAEGFIPHRRIADSLLYDEDLAGAVYQFQRRYGIARDSALGPETRRTMNVTVEERIRQIEANMERWRWLPHGFESRYLLVNVPAFRLHAYEGGEAVMDMAVIVGEEYTATPVFADSMSFLEFYPYWHIPMSIARRDILPAAARDPGHLARNGYEIVRQWTNDAQPIPVSSLGRSQLQPRNFPYRLRQRPGPTNALGKVKFMFPNEFAIYLHDTPGQQLFDRRVRTFSNGCIRVENPVALAEWVLAPNGGWDRSRIRSAMEGPTRRVDLEQKVPIYIVYLTTYVEGDELFFRQDIYDRDARLMATLSE
jgi:L,D-transpeptidase YcbB